MAVAICRKRVSDFYARLQAISVAGYDGMHLIYEALKKTNGSTNGSKLVEAM